MTQHHHRHVPDVAFGVDQQLELGGRVGLVRDADDVDAGGLLERIVERALDLDHVGIASEQQR